MRISSLHIDDPPTWRGGQAQVLHLLKGLRKASHRAELVSRPGSVLAERAEEAGVKVHRIRMRGEADVLAAYRIAKIVRSGRFDVVHMHTAHAHMLGCLACARNPEPLCVVSRRVDFPIRKHALSLSRIKYAFRVDHYIAISNAVKEVLVEGGVKPDKISIVHSGVEPRGADGDGPDIRREFGLADHERIIGTVGALVGHKGHRYLVEAVPLIRKKIPNARFILIGDGGLRADLEDLASRLGVQDAIIFAGFRPDAYNLMRQFELFAAPSHMEGLNTSILDAMMAERPIVATRAGGIPEIVVHEESGLLVPPKDPASLAKAILELLEDREKAACLASAGKQRATGGFTAHHMAQGTIAVYEMLLQDRCKN